MQVKINENELRDLFNQNVMIKDIAKRFNCSVDTIRRRLQKLGLKQGTSYRKPKQKEDPLKDLKNQIKTLYLEGNSCSKIGAIVGLSEKTISYHLRNMNVKIRDNKKINQEDFERLWNEGKSDQEIADYFGVSPLTIASFRTKGKNASKFKRTNFFSETDQTLSEIQRQFIYGSLLGDLNIGKPDKKHPNCRIYIVQCKAQEELFMKKVEILDNFMSAYKLIVPKPDPRTNKVYESWRGNSKAHPLFTEIRNKFYINGVKTITQELLNEITHPIALAYWFMDDGNYGGYFATNGFTEKEVNLLCNWLNNYWHITVTKKAVSKTNQFIIHVDNESRYDFEKLIFPYMVPSMYYKLKYLEELSEKSV